MNSNIKFETKNDNKEKIFLCKKVKKIKPPIFNIDKVKKIGKEVQIIKKEEKVEQRLRKYSEASTQFNDIEDAEVYLIKKESLLFEKDE